MNNMKMNGRSIITEYSGMSNRPEFYSGRGATTSDFNPQELEKIYDGVKKEWGDEAAACFVQFVYDQASLSATSFLNKFYVFVDCDKCKWEPQHVDSKVMDGIDVGVNAHRETIAAVSVLAFLGSMENEDATPQIRDQFLRRHQDEHVIDPSRDSDDLGNFVMGYGR